MIKTFFKQRAPRRVFYTPNVRIRSEAYGQEVHAAFLNWRDAYLGRWNKPEENFLLLEGGDIGGNLAKIGRSCELRVTEPRGKVALSRSKATLSPLFVEDKLLTLDKEGRLSINGEETDRFFGTELKAWGVSIYWEASQPVYTLLVIGKSGEGECDLTLYPFDRQKGPEATPLTRLPLPATLAKRSYLYAFGRHILLIHEAILYYYYYDPKTQTLSEVAIGEDDANAGKPRCRHVAPPVVCDSAGNVYWQSENDVYTFPIGYPSRVNCIEVGARSELAGIRCFKNSLFLYRKNRNTGEYSCLRYRPAPDGSFFGEVFNQGARHNMIFAERSGVLHYLKLPLYGKRAILARNAEGQETEEGTVDFGGEEDLFCIDGDLYLGYRYLGNETKERP